MTQHLPVSTLLLLLPALVAALTKLRRGLDGARALAAAGNLVVSAVAFAAAFAARMGRAPIVSHAPLDVAWLDIWPALGPLRLRFGFDPFATLAVPVLAATTTGILVAAPRSALTQRAVRLMLLMEAAAFGSLLAFDGASLVLTWGAWMAFGYLTLRAGETAETPRGARRGFAIYVGGSFAALLAGVAVLWVAGRQLGLAEPLDLAALARAGVPRSLQGPALVCIVIAALSRMGIAPFHTWLGVVASRGSLPLLSVHLAAPVGMAVLLRLAQPVLPEAAAAHMPVVLYVVIFSALYSALIGLVQRELRRAVVFVRTSQASLMLMGACVGTPLGLIGAGVQNVAIAVAIPSLLMVVNSLEARVGTASLSRLSGAVHAAPWAVAAWTLLSIATVGFPGTMGFIGEDLLMQSVIDEHPVAAFVLIFVTALNGMTLLLALFRGLLGPRPATVNAPPLVDLTVRERLPLAGAFLVLVLAGLLPHQLLLLGENLAPPPHNAAAHVVAHPAPPAGR